VLVKHSMMDPLQTFHIYITRAVGTRSNVLVSIFVIRARTFTYPNLSGNNRPSV